VKISGSHTLPYPPEKSYALMQDPNILCRAISGCEALEKTSDDEYRMKMKMALASFSGAFDGKVRILDRDPPNRFRMVVEGSGKLGFLKGDGLLTFTANGTGSDVSFDGEVLVGGTLAAVGQRLIDGTSKMIIKKFFEKLAQEAAAAG
jgi:carbon monoxide dehydrogenase subunit G